MQVKEFGNLRYYFIHCFVSDRLSFSPNSPNLRRQMDKNLRNTQLKQLSVMEDSEKQIRDLEANSAVAPSRLRGSTKGPGHDKALKYEWSKDKTVVSLPIGIETLKKKGWFYMEERFFKEFDKIRDVSLKLLFGPMEKERTLGTGEMEERVFTVAPFSDHRVILSPVEGAPEESDCTFYNASWIGKEFIGCTMPQGARAREAFWRMIYEYDIPVIVMLNEDSEGFKRHHDIQRYIPNVLKEWESYGIMEVRKVEQVNARNMSTTVRKIEIRRKDDIDIVKDVTHLQYRDWPDGGIPSDRQDYKEFMDYLLNLSLSFIESDRLICVHCFGGKGRTGTTIAALLELTKLKKYGLKEIDIVGTVSEMRTFRSMMVETLEQYKFIYWVVLSCFEDLQDK